MIISSRSQNQTRIFTNGNDTGAWQLQDLIAPDAYGSIWTYSGTVLLTDYGLIIGAMFDSSGPGGNTSGSCYAFQWDGTNWIERQQFVNSTPATYDMFGLGLGYADGRLIVGAPGDDPGGSCYAFRWNGNAWIQEQTFVAPEVASGDSFGCSVDISGDTAVVGAFRHNGNAGAAYVYTWNGTSWTRLQQLIAPDSAASDFFGFDVCIDGDTIAVGAWADDTTEGQNAGSVHIYTRTGSTWNHTQKMEGSFEWQYFGHSVDISSDTLVISADLEDGQAPGGTWESAYVYSRQGSTWTFSQTLFGDAARGLMFGNDVSVDEDIIAIDAPKQGYVYVYTRPPPARVCIQPAPDWIYNAELHLQTNYFPQQTVRLPFEIWCDTNIEVTVQADVADTRHREVRAATLTTNVTLIAGDQTVLLSWTIGPDLPSGCYDVMGSVRPRADVGRLFDTTQPGTNNTQTGEGAWISGDGRSIWVTARRVLSVRPNRRDSVGANHLTISPYAFSRGWRDRFATITDKDQFNYSCLRCVREGLWANVVLTNRADSPLVGELYTHMRYPNGAWRLIDPDQSFWGGDGWLVAVPPNSSREVNVPVFPDDPVQYWTIGEGVYQVAFAFSDEEPLTNSPDMTIEVTAVKISPPAVPAHGISANFEFVNYASPPAGVDIYNAVAGLWNVIRCLLGSSVELPTFQSFSDDLFADVRASLPRTAQVSIDVVAQQPGETVLRCRWRNRSVIVEGSGSETLGMHYDRAACFLDAQVPSTATFVSFGSLPTDATVIYDTDEDGNRHTYAVWHVYGVDRNLRNDMAWQIADVDAAHTADAEVTFGVRLELGPFAAQPNVSENGGVIDYAAWANSPSNVYWLACGADQETINSAAQGGIKDASGPNLLPDVWGAVYVDVVAASTGNYYVKILNGDMAIASVPWAWDTTESSLRSIDAGQLSRFTFSTRPDTESELFAFWLYRQTAIPGVFKIIDKVLNYLAVDADANGLSDQYETEMLDGMGQDPLADPDEDGASNIDEYRYGTDPMDPGSCLSLGFGGMYGGLAVYDEGIYVHAGEARVLYWPSVSNRTYAVQCWTNLLTQPRLVGFNLDATPPTNVFEDWTATNDCPHFYRILLE